MNSVRRNVGLVFLGIFAGLMPVRAVAGESVRVPLHERDVQAVETCATGRSVHDVDCRHCVAGALTSNGYLNFVVLMHALRAGGLTLPVIPVTSPNSERSRRMVETGRATARGEWDFNIDGRDAVLKTAAFVPPGTIVKGIYGLPVNKRLHGQFKPEDMAGLSAAMIPTWRLDWKILASMNLKHVEAVYTRDALYTMVANRGIDFTLLEFSSLPDMSRVLGGVRLVPAPGVKVALPNSRHFMISRAHPMADALVGAINRGLEVLHGDGFIKQCLVDTGVINLRVADWTVLNPDTEPLRADETGR